MPWFVELRRSPVVRLVNDFHGVPISTWWMLGRIFVISCDLVVKPAYQEFYGIYQLHILLLLPW